MPVHEIGFPPVPPGTDGYADTDANHPRLTPPEGDPVGDGKGWGPNGKAQSRATSPAGQQSSGSDIRPSKRLSRCIKRQIKVEIHMLKSAHRTTMENNGHMNTMKI